MARLIAETPVFSGSDAKVCGRFEITKEIISFCGNVAPWRKPAPRLAWGFRVRPEWATAEQQTECQGIIYL